MRPCPVCETPLDDRALECPTCGKELVAKVVADVSAGGMIDLDVGRADARTIQVAPDATPDVEHLSAVKVGAVATEVTPDLEQTARARVGDVVADITPDIELTKIADKEWTPDEEGPVLCRACRTPQTDTSSIFCQACGYRLPVRKLQEAVMVLDGEGAVGGEAASDVDPIKCPQCGCKTVPGGLCTACGVQLRPVGT